jgi:uncharacterized protein YndB with AHSA1/START domain
MRGPELAFFNIHKRAIRPKPKLKIVTTHFSVLHFVFFFQSLVLENKHSFLMPALRFVFEINTPAKVVYKALTTQKGITGWWTEDAMVPQGIGVIARVNFGSAYQNRLKIVDLIPYNYIEWECIEGHEEWLQTKFIFILEETSGDQTQVKFSHENWLDDSDFYARCNYIWGYYLQSLKDYCEKDKGHPFPLR